MVLTTLFWRGSTASGEANAKDANNSTLENFILIDDSGDFVEKLM